MTRTSHLIFGVVLCLFAPLLSATTAPPSVILIIGDGFDDQHVTMGRNYLKGAAGELLLDTLPFRGAVQVETVGFDDQPLYVADSANTATSMATGVVTQIGRIGTDRDDGDALTIAESALAAGLRAGVVTTASVTDATPASFMSHVAMRVCENPSAVLGGVFYGRELKGCPQDARENGGPGSIAEQIAESAMTVVLGGGAMHFSVPLHTEEQSTSALLAVNNGFRYMRDPATLNRIRRDDRLLGVFADKHLPVRWQGTEGRRAAVAGEDGLAPATMACEPNPNYGNTPSLSELTEVALEQLHNDDKGFFLMVESASIDKQSHSRNPCGSIGEIAQLEEALGVALEYAGKHENTLVLVTADHAQAAQILPEPTLFMEGPAEMYSPGSIARIITPEGSMMRINYATSSDMSSIEKHTGANVPLFANGAGASTLKPFMRQRELYRAMMNHLGLQP